MDGNGRDSPPGEFSRGDEPPDGGPESPRRYVLHATRYRGEFEIGMSVPRGRKGAYDLPSPDIHELLAGEVKDRVNVERLRESTTRSDWPYLGNCVVSGSNDAGMEIRLSIEDEWMA